MPTPSIQFWTVATEYHSKYQDLFAGDSKIEENEENEEDEEDVSKNQLLAAEYGPPGSGLHKAFSFTGLPNSATPTRETMLQDAQYIVDTFIVEKAKTQVNIKGPTKIQLLQVVEFEQMAQASEKASQAVDPKRQRLDANTFLVAQKEIFGLMQTDSFPRFKQSELFQEFLDKNEGLRSQAFSVSRSTDSLNSVRNPSVAERRANKKREDDASRPRTGSKILRFV